MNVSEFTYLLNKPDAINPVQILDLDRIISEFPYFQSARSILLKGLHAQDSFKYNQYLKMTAAHTTDRTVLFDFITSEHFTGVQKAVFETKETEIQNIEITETEETSGTAVPEAETTEVEIPVVIHHELIAENTLEKSILSSIKEATQDLAPEIETEEEIITEEIQPEKTEPVIETEKEEEKPVNFIVGETHSFQEWLQLSKLKPIDRTNENPENKTLEAKLDLIDKFIENNPKISPPKEDVNPPLYTQKNEDTSYLMTETLAKVYLEQRKYSKAIQAYEILILKYPEKSSLFADRISEIKDLQQNNNK